MNNINFCIEGGINTSYIDTLLMALFYKPSIIDTLINYPPTKSEFYYFQELLKLLVDSARRHYSIGSDLLNEIRNYSIICGWKQNENILELFDVGEYYEFIIDGTYIGKIKCELINTEENTIEEKIINIIDIPLNLIDNENISNRELLNKWIEHNLLQRTNNKNKYCYHFTELPNFITIKLNRFDSHNKMFDREKIDIMMSIKFDSNNDVNQSTVKWKIHSIICYSETNPHYYSILHVNTKWYIYDSYNIPSLEELNIKHEDMANKIKQECVLLFYKLEEFNY